MEYPTTGLTYRIIPFSLFFFLTHCSEKEEDKARERAADGRGEREWCTRKQQSIFSKKKKDRSEEGEGERRKSVCQSIPLSLPFYL